MSDGTLNFPLRATEPSAPTVGRSKIWVSSIDGKPKITDANGDTSGFTNIYGSDFSGDFENNQATNNTTTFQNYLTVPYQISDIGASALYELNISFIWNYSSGSNDFVGRILVNGIQFGEEFRQEPKDGGADQRYYTSFTALLSGSDLALLSGNMAWDFASGNGGNTARLYYTYLNLKRVK